MNALSPDVAVTGNHASTHLGCPLSLLLRVRTSATHRISTLGILT